MEDGRVVPGSIFIYAPNKGAPVFFAVGFFISTLLHAWQCHRYRCWKLTGIYVFANTVMTAGFVVRAICAFGHYDNVPLYIATICLVYAPPPLYELANYRVLGRILYYVPHLSPLHPGRVLSTFAFISAIIEALNGNGAAYTANADLPKSRQDTGRALLKTALILQVVVALLFLLLAAVFHRRLHHAGIRRTAVTVPLRILYISTTVILVRTIYRVVEYFTLANLHYSDGMDPQTLSPLLRYEWFFYVFEASLMLTNTWMLNAHHPRHHLPASRKTYLMPDGVTEATGTGYKDERPFWQTLVDPFGLCGRIRRRGGNQAAQDAESASQPISLAAAKSDLEAN